MTEAIMPRLFTLLCLGLSVATTACDNRKAEAASVSASASVVASNAVTTAALAVTDVKTNVAKIVFIGKEHACDCTRKKVETALAILHKVLGNPTKIPLDILQADTQSDQVQRYQQMKPMMALPALYFIDAKGSLVELLQGEVTEAQVTKALGI